jgi:NTP pyrophosphatase (non-canonical NTP hydrolase)
MTSEFPDLERLDVFDDVDRELLAAQRKFPTGFHNAHEGYAVLLEEVDEAWNAIKKNDILHAREEMVQVAAMAVRFLLEVKP